MAKVSVIPLCGMMILVGFVIFAEMQTGVYTSSLRRVWSSTEARTAPKDLPKQEASRDLEEELFEPAPTPDVLEDSREAGPSLGPDEELYVPSPTPDVLERIREKEPSLGPDEDPLEPAPKPDLREDLHLLAPTPDAAEEVLEPENPSNAVEQDSESETGPDPFVDLAAPAPAPDIEEGVVEPEPHSNAVEQVSKPEVETDQETLPQPTTSLDLEELSKSVQSDLTPCSANVKYFRKGMSPECRKLWREDLFTRPLPQQFVYVHSPANGTRNADRPRTADDFAQDINLRATVGIDGYVEPGMRRQLPAFAGQWGELCQQRQQFALFTDTRSYATVLIRDSPTMSLQSSKYSAAAAC